MSMPGESVSRVSRRSDTRTVQMSALPERAEKKTRLRLSGAHSGW